MNQTPDVPDFYALVQSHAKGRPDAIAVADGARRITYAQFVVDIETVSRRLNTHGLAPGSRAVVFMSSPYLHWLAVIALWRIRVISVSVFNLTEPGLFELLRANVLISDHDNLTADGGGAIALTNAWLSAGADTLPPIAERPFDANQPVRILLSSGTTGTPKKILFSNAIIGARIRNTIADYGIGPQTRLMSVVGLDTAGGFVYSVVTWAAGGSVAFYEREMPFDQLMILTGANLLFMSPVQAANIVNTLPDNSQPDPALTLMVAGGRLPQIVGERTKARLASTIWVIYGSTEAGTVTLSLEPEYANPELVGPLVPTAEVQIVDSTGQAVSHGTIGEVRMRGVCCVTSYLDDPDGSRAYFKDGWFHPGDLGTLSESGALSVVGRVGDVMNLGGLKIAPGVIEDALFECRGVKDLAAFSVPDAEGTESLWLAVSAGKDFVQDALLQFFRERFPHRQPPNVALVDEIPRNGMAKVQRNLLRDRVKQELAAEAAGTITVTFESRPTTAGANTKNQEKWNGRLPPQGFLKKLAKVK